MNAFDFAKLCESGNVEDALGAIFDAAHDKWSEEIPQAITEGQRIVLAVETFFGEVLNGGFYQYFSNESGGLANFAPFALKRIGLQEYAKVLESFILLFPDGIVEEDSELRQSQLDEIEERYDDEEFFEQLERPFWDLWEKHENEYAVKLFDYIVANETQFVER